MGIVCVVKHWPPADDLATTTTLMRLSMISVRSASKRYASWSRLVLAAHYCRRWPRFRRNVPSHHSSSDLCNLPMTADALDWYGVEAIRKRESWHCSVI